MNPSRYNRVGLGMNPSPTESGSFLWSAFWALLVLLGVVAFALSVTLMVWDADNIKRIQGVPPLNNEVKTLSGPGIAITPSVPGHSLTFNNTGVLSATAGQGIIVSPPAGTGHILINTTAILRINGQAANSLGDYLVTAVAPGILVSPGAANEILVANTGVLSNVAGAGISVSAATGHVTVTNTGVRSVAAGTGIAVSAATGDAVTISNTGVTQVTGSNGIEVVTAGTSRDVQHSLTKATVAPLSGSSPHQYLSGLQIANMTENAWFSASSLTLNFPTAVSGLFDVRAHCILQGSTNAHALTILLTAGANTTNPLQFGFVPAGGRATYEITVGSSNTTVPRAFAASGLFHVGCTGCPVPVNANVGLHARIEAAGAATADLECVLQMARLI